MNASTYEPLNLPREELAVLSDLLENARAKLLVEIRHTDHRAFRDELRHRLTLLESLIERCGTGISAGARDDRQSYSP